MKFILITIAALIAVTSFAADQRDVGVMTYNGKSYSECRVDTIDTQGIHITSKNGSFVIPLDKAPFTIRGRFKSEYDAAVAETRRIANQPAEKAVLERKIAESEARIDAIFDEQRKKMAPMIAAGAFLIYGRVLQKLPEGVLVSPQKPDSATSIQTTGVTPYNNVALLRGHPDIPGMVDGDSVASFGVLDGQFTYTDTQGANRAVRAFKWFPNPNYKAEKK